MVDNKYREESRIKEPESKMRIKYTNNEIKVIS